MPSRTRKRIENLSKLIAGCEEVKGAHKLLLYVRLYPAWHRTFRGLCISGGRNPWAVWRRVFDYLDDRLLIRIDEVDVDRMRSMVRGEATFMTRTTLVQLIDSFTDWAQLFERICREEGLPAKRRFLALLWECYGGR